jgi:hypothetical protein
MRNRTSFRLAALSTAIIIMIAIVAAMPPFAHADAVSHARIVRLSFLEGDVAYQNQSGGSTWARAVQNLPIREGFSLRTDSGYAEVEFESGLVVHLAGNTQLEFTELNLTDGHKVTSLKLDHGTMIATANLQKGDEVTIASGSGLVTVPRSGRVRIDSAQAQNWVTVFHGKADVVTGGSNTSIESGKTLHFGPAMQGVDAAQSGDQNLSSVDRSPKTDAFDKWAAQREEAQQNAQSDSEEFLRPRDYAFSTADLYNYGLWSNISGYGMAWQPYGMGANWMPFSNGMWMFDDMGADWMWASGEPWGWLPYHYGGWVFLDGEGWFWIPQDLGFFRGGNANFVNVGNQVGWTPTLATPTNPRKVRISPVTPTTPTRVVFAGGGSKGVIVAGPRGIVGPTSTLRVGTRPASTFTQTGAPTLAALGATGVTVTSRGPAPENNTRTYTAHGPSSGTNFGGGVPRNGAPGNVGAPTAGRPTVPAPHTAPIAVMRPPSTFAVAGSGGRNSGVTPMNSSAMGSGPRSSGGGGTGGSMSSTAANGSNGGSNGGGAGRPAGGGASGGSGGTAPAGGGATPLGGTKH